MSAELLRTMVHSPVVVAGAQEIDGIVLLIE
jgi:hypothetical protein